MTDRQEPRAARKRKRRSVGSYIIQDLLMTLVFLCVFALFHHVLPMWRPQVSQIVAPVPVSTAHPSGADSRETPAPTEAPESPEGPSVTPEPAPEETAPPATEAPLTWRELFGEFFSDEVVVTKDSYTSSNVSIQIEYHEESIGGIPQHYYLADIRLADVHCLRTAPAYNGFTVYSAEDALDLDRRNGAILAVNGDYCNVQRYGLLVRNGDIYFSDPTVCDICVLYEDGVMETYEGGSYEVQEIMDRVPYQIWRFGPALLDGEGKARSGFENTAVMNNRHPRTGLGYYEPGHYCFVVFEGRFNDAGGLSMEDFAAFFESLGCRSAYNMDGGASSVMTFDDRVLNRQSGDRALGDIIFICEPDTPWPEIVS